MRLLAIGLAILLVPVSGRAEPTRKRVFDSIEKLTGGATSPAGLPIIVAIHELGGSPESFARWLEELKARARLVLPRGTSRFGRGFAWLPGRYHPRRAAEELRMARLMADFIRGLVADARRPVIVTGFSQGAILSYAVAALVPELVAAAVPVAGYLPERVEPVGSAKDHGKVRIRAIHGEKDPVLTVARARSSVERLRKSGFDVKLHEHPGVGHTITTEMAAELRATLQALLTK